MTYLGHVAGERARQVWAAADAFVLPSYSEGFSMAVLEALACRLPCLITTACHFPELAAADGGIEVTPDIDAVSQGLRRLDRTHAGRARPDRTNRPPARRGALHVGSAGGTPGVRLRVAQRRRSSPRGRHLVTARPGMDLPCLSNWLFPKDEDESSNADAVGSRRATNSPRAAPDATRFPSA